MVASLRSPRLLFCSKKKFQHQSVLVKTPEPTPFNTLPVSYPLRNTSNNDTKENLHTRERKWGLAFDPSKLEQMSDDVSASSRLEPLSHRNLPRHQHNNPGPGIIDPRSFVSFLKKWQVRWLLIFLYPPICR